MIQPMVVTNVRIPRSNYLQIKARAGELGVSFNKYINTLVKDSMRRQMMRSNVSQSMIKKQQSFWKAMERISKIKGKPMGWSEEDKAIYSV